MANILVRGIPDDIHSALQHKAAQRHQSLQQYLSLELRRLAERHSLSDVLDEIEARDGGRVGLQQAVEDLREERRRV